MRLLIQRSTARTLAEKVKWLLNDAARCDFGFCNLN